MSQWWCRPTRLCRNGPECRIPHCPRAHSLCQLGPPNEVCEKQDCIWNDGVDRWFGQVLSDEQIDLLLVYHHVTPCHLVSIWMHGLIYVLRGGHYVEHMHMSWDYGLCADIDCLKMARRGPVPFVYMASSWGDLHRRRHMLELEQTVLGKPCRGIHKEV